MQIQQLASRGLTFGLHVVTGAARWADFRAAMRDLIGTRLELKLGDAMDSEIDRKVAQLVPAGRPGRGLVRASCTSSARCRASTARPTPTPSATASTTSSRR